MGNSITSINHLLDALGGDAEIASKYGVSKNCVSMWRVRQHISNAFHLRIFADARRKGLDVCPSIFGLNNEEAEGLFHSVNHKDQVSISQNVV